VQQGVLPLGWFLSQKLADMMLQGAYDFLLGSNLHILMNAYFLGWNN
jgi:hypothetical protein